MTRLMCSTRQEEVAAVKSELFKAGIRSEIRKNPVTAALNIKRLEVWVENEKDLFAAQECYARMQARAGNGHEPAATAAPTKTAIDVENPPAASTWAVSWGGADPDGKNSGRRTGGELEQASLLLEKEIEEILKREDTLSEACAALRSETENLSQSLSESQAAAVKKAAEFAALRNSLERELAEHTRSEDQLKGEVRELQSRLKSADATLLERHRKLESTLQQLQTQQSMVVELRKEIVSREQAWDEHKGLVSKAHAELAVEQQARLAAEEKLAKSALAQERLEKQLANHKDLQDQLRASLGSLNSLRGRLQAKKTSVRA
jgi:hypothetical protein